MVTSSEGPSSALPRASPTLSPPVDAGTNTSHLVHQISELCWCSWRKVEAQEIVNQTLKFLPSNSCAPVKVAPRHTRAFCWGSDKWQLTKTYCTFSMRRLRSFMAVPDRFQFPHFCPLAFATFSSWRFSLQPFSAESAYIPARLLQHLWEPFRHRVWLASST